MCVISSTTHKPITDLVDSNGLSQFKLFSTYGFKNVIYLKNILCRQQESQQGSLTSALLTFGVGNVL